MKPYGLTGGMGCGKSTLASLLASFGWKVVDTDEIAHRLLQPEQKNWKNVIDAFGESILNKDRSINRHILADLVFGDSSLRKKLNEAVHPEIRRTWSMESKQLQKENPQKKVVVVIPLLFETHVENEFESILCIGCSAPVQRRRLQNRNWTEQHLQQRLASQLPLEQKMARSHFIFWNDGSPAQLQKQTEEFLKKI